MDHCAGRPDLEEAIGMRAARIVLGIAALIGFATTLSTGCGSSEVGIAPAPTITPPASKPLPADPKQGGGKGSSGNMGRNPGASS